MHIRIKVDVPQAEEPLIRDIYSRIRYQAMNYTPKFTIAMYRVYEIKLESQIVAKEVLMKADDRH